MFVLFFFNDTATTEIYTLSLHDALPISSGMAPARFNPECAPMRRRTAIDSNPNAISARRLLRRAHPPSMRPLPRSEEHTSELQSRQYLVCRLLLEKKKRNQLRVSLTATS